MIIVGAYRRVGAVESGRRILRAGGVLGAVVLGALAPAPASGSSGWTPPTSITPSSLDVGYAGAARTSTGEVVLALSLPNPGATPGLGIGVLAAGRTSIGPVAPLSRGNAFAARVIADGQGDAYVSWLQQDASGISPVIERTPDGTIHAALGLPDGVYDPVVAADRAGEAAAVWTLRESDGAHLQIAFKASGAGAFGAPIDLAGVLPSGIREVYPKVAMDGNGTAVVAWTEAAVDRGAGQLQVASVIPTGEIHRQALTATSLTVGDLQLVQSDAGVLAVWSESLPGDAAGSLRGASEPDSGSFGSPFDIGTGTQGTLVDAGANPVFTSQPDGRVLGTWETFRPNPHQAGAAMGDAIVQVDGDLRTGRFSAPVALLTLYGEPVYGPGAPTGVALGSDGSALIVLSFGKVSRRDGAGAFTEQFATCELGASAILTEVGPGTASFLWTDPSSSAGVRPVHRSSTSDGAAPQVCPTRPQGVVITPSFPVIDQPVTIDASGLANPDAVTNTWSWDLDGDGVLEIPFGQHPVETVTFYTAGAHELSVRTQFTDARGGGGGGGNLLRVYVYTPYNVPTGGYHPTPGLIPPAAPGARAASTATFSATVTAGQRLRGVLRDGLAIRLRSSTATTAEVTIHAARRTVGRARTRLAARQSRTVHVRLRLAGLAGRRQTLRIKVRGQATTASLTTTIATR